METKEKNFENDIEARLAIQQIYNRQTRSNRIVL